MEYLKSIISRITATFREAGKKNGNELTGLCFAVIITLVFTLNLVIPDRSFSEGENRMLQEFPTISARDYVNGRLESSFENYANDQFMLRDCFIRIKSAFDLAAGNVKSNDVWKGRDGYLIEDTVVPSKRLLKEDYEALERFRKENRKLKLRFMLAPNAVSIMKDKLPAGANPADQDTLIDSFYEKLDELGYETLDVREDFRSAAKNGRQLYYYTDHHWTSEGAGLAFAKYKEAAGLKREVNFTLKPVKNDFLGTMASKSGYAGGRKDTISLPVADKESFRNSVISYEDTQEKTTAFYQLDKLSEKDAYQVFGGNNHSIYRIKTPVKGNRRLLLIKDSYANSVIPYLMQYYTEIIVVDPRYYYDDIQDEIDLEGVQSVLFLYNANTFFGDNSLKMMLDEEENE